VVVRLGLAAVLAALLVGCDWAAFGSDAARTRIEAHVRSAPPAPVPELIEAWRGWTGGPVSSPPAVADGGLYVGSEDGYLYAFDEHAVASCARYRCMPRWRGDAGGPVTSSPALASGTVFVGSGGGGLRAFDVARCASAPGEACAPVWVGAPGAPVEASPVVVGGTVVVGSLDGNVYAFDAAGCGAPTCAARWRGAVGAPVRSSPAVASDDVYVGADDGRLYAFDAAGCASAPATPCDARWRGSVGAPIRATPAVASGTVFVGADNGRVYAFDVAGCAVAPAVACTARWYGVTHGRVRSSPAVDDGTVYVGSGDGRLYAFPATASDACSSSPRVCPARWTGVTRGPVSSSPAVAAGIVYAGSDDGILYGFSTTGTCPGTPAVCPVQWREPIGGALRSSPSVANGVLYAGSSAGGIVAVRAAVHPVDASLESMVITPERLDTYAVAGSSTVRTTAAATNTGLDTRVSFVRRSDPEAADEQSCATWTEEGAGWNQQGAVLRARTLPDGNRRGVLVTKNVWMNAHWIFNVHVWDTSLPQVFQPIAFFDLEDTFRPNGQVLPLPWSFCARVVGDVVSFIAWPASMPRPAWNDARFGGSVVLPEGWSEPGRAGWYAGHLGPGHAVAYTGLDSGPVLLDGTARPGFGPEPTTAPKLPARVVARL
jgi:outer membrane protein assembly factor BamB